MNEVDAPDMVRMRRPEANDRTVLVIKPSALFVPLRELQSFFLPETLNLLMIDPPAFDAQEFQNLTIAVAPILLGQADQSQP